MEAFSGKAITTAIHKNDVMLHHQLKRNVGETKKGVEQYFNIGLEGAIALRSIANQAGKTPQTLLDFGSGYGRSSRFFKSQFPNTHITVSEVKAEAMEFQKVQFGYETITHSEQASSFPGKTFDLINALSVFTHLNQKDFEDWLATLSKALNEGGTLVFTYNDINESPTKAADFHFANHSEDSSFSYIKDALIDTASYGSTYVSKGYLEKLAGHVGCTIKFMQEGIAAKQSTAVLSN